MEKHKQLEPEYLEGEVQINWKLALSAFRNLARAMNEETELIAEEAKLRNTYSPKALANIYRELRYYTSAMRAVRLRCEGRSSRAIAAEMGRSVRQVGSWTAWNTIRGKDLNQRLKNLGTSKEDRAGYEIFLNEIGIFIKRSATGVKNGK